MCNICIYICIHSAELRDKSCTWRISKEECGGERQKVDYGYAPASKNSNSLPKGHDVQGGQKDEDVQVGHRVEELGRPEL